MKVWKLHDLTDRQNIRKSSLRLPGHSPIVELDISGPRAVASCTMPLPHGPLELPKIRLRRCFEAVPLSKPQFGKVQRSP